MTELVVGIDSGGTSTRVAVADLSGEIVALSTGGPGNPNSVGVEGSAAEIRAVMDQALGQLPAGAALSVGSVVIGLAGGSRAAADPGFVRAATSSGVLTHARLVSDLTVAFCSATPSPQGFVLVAGTGAVAGEIAGDELVRQRDGWGWLLGDEGSGFWLGRAAVRVTLDALQQDSPLGSLAQAVLAATGTGGYADLLQSCYAAGPTRLAQLSGLVSQHAAADPAAAGIADEAVTLLERLLSFLGPDPHSPLVLAGSVLTQPGPVSSGFRERLARRATPVLIASNPVVGALWTALRPRIGDARAHARLVASAQRWL